MACHMLVVTIIVTTLTIPSLTPVEAKSVTKAFKLPADLTYEELVYILQSRNAVVTRKPIKLSPCARAILGCCIQKVINPTCSERLGCGAHFFDDNPCDDNFYVEALEAARNFYEQFN